MRKYESISSIEIAGICIIMYKLCLNQLHLITQLRRSLDNNDLANYKKKVNYYILQHQDIPAIARLKGNESLSLADVRSLENILWNELGTKEQYAAQYGATPLGELVRSIVWLDQRAANEAFSSLLTIPHLAANICTS